jgi:two-component system response regulator RegX3
MTAPLVLIVEDDEKLADVFSLALQAADFETEMVRDGAAALAWLAKSVPDVVILDLHLPYVAGPDILRQIRADTRLSKTKVILVTADDRLADVLREQADLVLLKPISPEHLCLLATRMTSPAAARG